MIMQPIDKFVRSQRLSSNARTLNASIHVAMVCELLDLDEEESSRIAEASARVFRLLKKELPLSSKYRKDYRMGTFMRNVEQIKSYIASNMIFGDSEQLFKLMEIEKRKIAGEIE
tara:strand:- start:2423 stop:2767 length:345 start_codon:yes stop_codon:yes gene_type:complete